MEPTDNHPKEERHDEIRGVFNTFAKLSCGVDFGWGGNSLEKVEQKDSSSCGPCAISLLERLADEGIPLWTPQGANAYRVDLFLRMARHAIAEMVSSVV